MIRLRIPSLGQLPLFLPPVVFASVNACYLVLFDLPLSTVTLFYVVVLEFAAIGLSFNVAEILCAWTFGEILPPRSATLEDFPPVALLCVTCDDSDPDVLRLLNTQTYSNLTVFVLDDSRSERHRSIVDASGLPVFRRENRDGYKAGNLNNWLRNHGRQFMYFVVADADSILPPDFVDTMVRYAEHPANRDIAMFESLIRAWNTTSLFAALLDALAFLPARYRLRVTNRLGSTLSVGHNNLYRTDAVASLGGFTEHFLAEDFATCITLVSGGTWRCRAVPVISFERQPENIGEFARRQSRWAYQTLQLLELDVPRLSWSITLELFRALHYYISPLVMILGLLLSLLVNLQELVLASTMPSAKALIEGPMSPLWLFFLTWLLVPILGVSILARHHGVALRHVLGAVLLNSALFTVTSWVVARQVALYARRQRRPFTVTGRRMTPTLLDTFLIAGPVGILLWSVMITTCLNPAALPNLAWLIPACLGPLIVYVCQRSR